MATPTRIPSVAEVSGWSSEQLLAHLGTLFSTFRPDQLEKFTEAEIDGDLFLQEGRREWFQDVCSLKPGPAAKLALEVKRIKDENAAHEANAATTTATTTTITTTFSGAIPAKAIAANLKRQAEEEPLRQHEEAVRVKTEEEEDARVKIEPGDSISTPQYEPPPMFSVSPTSPTLHGVTPPQDTIVQFHKEADLNYLPPTRPRRTGANTSAINVLQAGTILEHDMRIRRIKIFWDRINNIDSNPSKYSEPGKWLVLPFPCEDYNINLGFSTNDRTTTFEYFGREKFEKVYNEVMELYKTYGQGEYLLRGCEGSGKTHVLLALACLLMKQRYKVLYLPDAHHLAYRFVDYVQASLLVTYGDQPAVHQRIKASNTKEKLIETARNLNSQMFVIVDQWDRIDDIDIGPYVEDFEIEPGIKDETVRAIKRLSHGRLLISATSRNPFSNGKGVSLDGGLSEVEMTNIWSKLNTYLQFGDVKDEDKRYIEEQTGKLPALLRPIIHLRTELTPEIYPEKETYRLYDLLWNSQSPPSSFHQVHGRVYKFCKWMVNNFKTDGPIMQRLLKAWITCLCESALSDIDNKCIDWRFFHKQSGIVSPTSGLARESLAAILRRMDHEHLFTGSSWLQKLEYSGHNHFFVEFLVKSMLIASFASSGCSRMGKAYAGERLQIFGFDKEFFNFDEAKRMMWKNGKALALYLPDTFQAHEIDALMLSLNWDKTSNAGHAYVLAIHISITPHYTEVESAFFRKWDTVKSKLNGFKITPVFLKLTESMKEALDMVVVSERAERTVHGETVPGNPQYRKIYRTISEIDTTVGKSLAKARNLARLAEERGINRGAGVTPRTQMNIRPDNWRLVDR